MRLVSAESVVFISPKHSDRGIAEILARFVKNETAEARPRPHGARGTESRQKGHSCLPNS